MVFLLGGTFFLYVAWFNGSLLFRGIVKKQHVPSVIPIIGGLIGFGALRLSPVEVVSDYAWTALILDYGCGSFLGLAVAGLLVEACNTCRLNRLHIYEGINPTDANVDLRLITNHSWLWRKGTRRAEADTGTRLVEQTTGGHWKIEENKLLLDTHDGVSIRFRIDDSGRIEWIESSNESIFDRLSFAEC